MGRRLAPLLAVMVVLAGCGGEQTVSPTAKEVVGTVPTATQAAVPTGNAKAGAGLFKSQGCGGCHTFKPAGTTKTIGPDLDKLADYAKKANRGSTAEFAFQSIKDPSAYIEKGYGTIAMPKFPLSDKQIADLVAYLTKS